MGKNEEEFNSRIIKELFSIFGCNSFLLFLIVFIKNVTTQTYEYESGKRTKIFKNLTKISSDDTFL